MLFTNKGIYAVTKWLIGQEVLQQFQTAYKIQQEDTKEHALFQALRDWTPPSGLRQYNSKLPDPPTTL